MEISTRRKLLVTGILAMAWCGNAYAVSIPDVSIYNIQYVDLSGPHDEDKDNSPYDGQTVNCRGGIVTHIFERSVPKLVLVDPNNPTSWGGITVRGLLGPNTFAGLSVGDRVDFTDVLVEEFYGSTFLQYGDSSYPGYDFTKVSSGNPVPPPVVVTLDEIAAPVEGPPGDWTVSDYSAEPYEGMWCKVEDVTVTAMDLGKADDNYNLHNADGDAWASDYMNADKGASDLYHPDVYLGQHFASVTGVIEQYSKLASGWDYYQLLTSGSGDLVVPEPATALLFLVPMALMRRKRG